MLELVNVEKSYGEHSVLDVPHFNFSEGMFWLKGENGSGKTTLLKLIAGLIPFKGDVRLAEECTIKKNRIQYLQKINYTEAEPLYPPFITGDEMIALFIKSKGGELTEMKNIIQQLRVDAFSSQQIGTYSSGMNKKLSLVLAFIGKPDWILLDEPLVTIDVASVDVVYRIIHEHHTQKKVNFIITSHHDFENSKIEFTNSLIMRNKNIVKE